MGREIKRVPLDFNWPLKEVWEEFLNPYSEYLSDCPACDGSGYNPQTKQLADDWYDFAGTGRRWCSSITQDEYEEQRDHDKKYRAKRQELSDKKHLRRLQAKYGKG